MPCGKAIVVALAGERTSVPSRWKSRGCSRPRRSRLSYLPLWPRKPGEVSEWLKEQHWKCCSGLKPARGFESRPLRYFLFTPCGPPAERDERLAARATFHALADPIWFNTPVPSPKDEQRKLAAIMFTDMVGYTTL